MNTLLFTIPSESEMLRLGRKLAKATANQLILFLYGPLGAGKTTFVRGFLRELGYQDKVKSPTYTLVEPYHLPQCDVFHFDFYRLNATNELEHIGIHEYFSTPAICLLEWPEKALPLLPSPDLACYITFVDQAREVRLQAYSALGESILKRI